MYISELINILSAIQKDQGDIPVQIYFDKDQEYSGDFSNPQSNILVDNVKMVKISDDSKNILLSNEYNEHTIIDGYNCDIMFKNGEYLGQIKPPYSDTIIPFRSTDKYHLSKICMNIIEKHKEQYCKEKIEKTYQKIKDIQS